MRADPTAGHLAGPSIARLGGTLGALPLGAIFGAIGAAGVAAVGLLHLDRLPFPVCYLKALSGLPCPTCGSTRAMAHLFMLDLRGALAMNPLTTVVALGFVLWGLADLLLLARGRALRLQVSPAAARLLRVVAVVVVLANWVYLVAVGR